MFINTHLQKKNIINNSVLGSLWQFQLKVSQNHWIND